MVFTLIDISPLYNINGSILSPFGPNTGSWSTYSCVNKTYYYSPPDSSSYDIILDYTASNQYVNFAKWKIEDLGLSDNGIATIVSDVLKNELSGLDDINQSVQDVNQSVQDTNQSVQDVNDTLNDSSIDNPSSSFNEFNDKTADSGPITQLLLMPVTLYTSINNNLSGVCQPLNLGKLYGHNLTMPCINYNKYLGSELVNILDILMSGFMIFTISKTFIKIFENFTTLKEGDVLDD